MDAVFKKMSFKNHENIVVLNEPDSFHENMDNMKGLTVFHKDVNDVETIEYAIAFATKQVEVEKYMKLFVSKIEGDAIIWICYPKKSSKKYTCDFTRDTGWEIMGELGFEPVRMVAVDKDWSALRFRNVKYIKKITRRKTMALTKEAKKRTTNKN